MTGARPSIKKSSEDRTHARLSLCSLPHLFYKIDDMSREVLGNFEMMVLLAILRTGEEAYGVTIARELESSSGAHVLLGSA